MATNEKSSEVPPPSYNTPTAPEYPQPMPMPQSMSSPKNPTMSSPMHQPMLQPMPPQMQQTFYSPEGAADHTNEPIIVSPGHQDWRPIQQTFSPPPQCLQPRLPKYPTTLVCPFCRNQIVTRVEYKNSFRTHVIAAMCCIMGCFLCMWIPYCNNTFKTPEQYCPTCNTYLGCCTDFRAYY